jgi:hypothetical protein
MSDKKREVVGTKYFLLLFGDFKDNNFLLEQILGQFEPVLCSKFIKFHFTDEYVIAHFETEESPKDIKEFCKIVLEDIIDNYILLIKIIINKVIINGIINLNILYTHYSISY